eukprot:4203960-Alexandrium_andersonii.AAC.1
MSASLVGSEMCIRDRGLALHPQVHRDPPRAGGRVALRCQGALRPVVPVSYTHLTLPTICSV